MSAVQPEVTAPPVATTPAVPTDAEKLAKAIAENQQLKYDLAQAEAKLAAQLQKKGSSPFMSGLKKFGASVLAAFTTPTAIKAEKSLAVIAFTRFLILVPGAAAVIDIILAALGGPSVGVK